MRLSPFRALAFATYSTALIVEFRCYLTFCNAMYDNPTIQLLSFCRQPIHTQVVVYMYYVVLSPSLCSAALNLSVHMQSLYPQTSNQTWLHLHNYEMISVQRPGNKISCIYTYCSKCVRFTTVIITFFPGTFPPFRLHTFMTIKLGGPGSLGYDLSCPLCSGHVVILVS